MVRTKTKAKKVVKKASKITKSLEEVIEAKIGGNSRVDCSMGGVVVEDEQSNTLFDVSFDITELHYCCGIDELGRINIEWDEEDDRLSERDKVRLISKSLKKLVVESGDYKGKTKGERKLLINIPLTENGGRNKDTLFYLMLEAIEDSNLFEMVSEFKNSNSENTLRTYITK